MLRESLRSFRFPAEAVTLAVLMFFLPLLEAAKNIAWLAFVLVWIANRIRARDAGGRWDLWDTLILAWIASAYVVAAYAGLHRSEWGGANDLLRYGLVLWLVKRSGYGPPECRLIIGTLLVSALAGLPQAYWQRFISHTREWFELNSVGQVNHTAIYLAIVLGMSLSAVLAYWRAWPRTARALGLLAVANISLAVIMTTSRAAAGVGVVLVLVLTAAWMPRMKSAFVTALSVALMVVAFAWSTKIDVVRKQQTQAEKHDVLSNRNAIWNNAMAAWERFPLFGVGMDNFSEITLDRVREWRTESGRPFDQARHWQVGSHGHSLVFNTLAERGMVGSAALLAVLLAWIVSLVRHRPRAADGDLHWALWGGALSAWFVSVGTGLVNTSLHHEHAILSVTLLGLWLAHLRGRSGP